MNSENLSEEIQESGCLLLADGLWDPLGDEPRPLEYTMRKKGERTYTKNATVDTIFFKSKLTIDTRANASETYDEVFMVCSKTSSKRRVAIWRPTIWDVW